MTRLSEISPKRAVFSGVLVLLLGLWTYKAGKEGLSGFYLHSAYQRLQRPAATEPLLQEQEWLSVMTQLIESLRYSPRNPLTLEAMGEHQLRRKASATDARVPMIAVQSANINFHMALTQSPTSARAWANLMLTKLNLGQQDEEFFAALRHADELSPWEPGVQEAVLLASLTAWDRLGTDQRAEAVRTLERAAQGDVERIANLLARFKRLNLLCDMKHSKPKVQEACERLRKSTTAPSPRAR